MATKAPIYTEEYQIVDIRLLKQLKEAIVELEEKMKATVPITQGLNRVGWGVSKTHRGIAADAVISITKAIKSLRGW